MFIDMCYKTCICENESISANVYRYFHCTYKEKLVHETHRCTTWIRQLESMAYISDDFLSVTLYKKSYCALFKHINDPMF